MPPVNWGIEPDSVDDFDPNDRYTPYMGPTDIAAGMYVWRIATMKRVPRTREKMPQLRVGLELVPRKGNAYEKRYAKYFAMDFIPVSDKTAFRYNALLALLGVSGMDFTRRTKVDEDGNVKSIGKWKNDGKTLIAAQLVDGKDMDGNLRKEIKGGAYFAVPEDLDEEDFDDEDLEDDEDVYDDDVDIEDEEGDVDIEDEEGDEDEYEEDDEDYEDEEDEDEDEATPARRGVKKAVQRSRTRAQREEEEYEERQAAKAKGRRSAASAGTRGRTTAAKTTGSRRTSGGSKATSTRRRTR